MVIKSPFKDYYDFVANKYGGGDPRLVYPRNRIDLANQLVEVDNCQLTDPSRYYWYRLKSEPQMDYLYLVVAGKAYLLVRPSDPYLLRDLLDDFKVKIIDQEDKKPRPSTYLFHWNYGIKFGEEYQFLVELCRKVQAPVFIITKIDYMENRRATVSIYERCPILSQLGMASIIDPYQMYQDLSMFMGNKMKDTPDTKPPVELSNKQRILKAGFDLVQSFRHRK